MPNISFKNALITAAVIRLGLIFYSEYHDRHAIVKYTDVDYRVFTDAARFLLKPQAEGNIAEGPFGSYFGVGSPYSRETYRYTPLLALIMTPNIFLHPSFGKFIFSVCDLVIGWMLYVMVCLQPPFAVTQQGEIERKATVWVSALWLLNPLVFSISTRGSSESVLGILVIGTLFSILKNRHTLAAILLGLSVHWKIYPIIYGVSILAFYGSLISRPTSQIWLSRLFTTAGIKFGVISALTFTFVTGFLYLIWGYPLLWNSYLYHLGRRDHRHNFSPYFYPTYLAYPSIHDEANNKSSLASHPLISFVPQMALSLGAGILLGSNPADLPLAWFIQTMIFVTYNKVCTSQYFIWYIWFLPQVLPRLQLSIKEAILMTSIWIGSQAIWLAIAYRLEFLGEPVFLELWLASVLFFLSNCWIVSKILTSAFSNTRSR